MGKYLCLTRKLKSAQFAKLELLRQQEEIKSCFLQGLQEQDPAYLQEFVSSWNRMGALIKIRTWSEILNRTITINRTDKRVN